MPVETQTWASVAAANAPPASEQPHPDTSLLQTAGSSTASLASTNGSSINMVTSADLADLKESIDPSSNQAHEADSAEFKAAKKATDAALKDVPTSRVTKADVDKLEARAEQWAKDGKSKVEGWEKEAEKKGKALGKKAAKKASELEKEGEALVRKYPAAATGIVGLANLAVVAAVGVVAYQNWDKPRWDRRTVSAVSIGLLALFGGEGYLGYYEYEKEHAAAK
ncbi:hypothetical protein RQP46_008887 [Phenoliferia psychrophenolica]